MPKDLRDPPHPPLRYAAQVRNAASLYGIQYRLLVAVLWTESRFRPDIIDGTTKSPAGALGIAQFMPATAASLGIDPLDPDQAIPACARYLAQLHFLFGSWRHAVAAYNCGPSRLAQGGLDHVPPETKAYLAKVQAAL